MSAAEAHFHAPGGPVLRHRVVGRGPDELVFAAPDGGHLRNGNWRSRSGWARVTKELGLADVTPHDLRRTFGSLARAAGADLRWIQRAMGHESINTTARVYAHLYDDELDIVAAALDPPWRRGWEPVMKPPSGDLMCPFGVHWALSRLFKAVVTTLRHPIRRTAEPL